MHAYVFRFQNASFGTTRKMSASVSTTIRAAASHRGSPGRQAGAEVRGIHGPPSAKPGARYAWRVNYALEAYDVPTTSIDVWSSLSSRLAGHRGNSRPLRRALGKAYEGQHEQEARYYPCYKQRRWTDTHYPTRTLLKLQMPNNYKEIRALGPRDVGREAR